MRRGIRHSGKSFRSHDESARTYQCETEASDTHSMKNQKKSKNAGKPRSFSVHDLLRDSKDGHEEGKISLPLPSAHAIDPKLPLRKFYKLYSKIVIQLETVKAFTETKRNESENLVDLRRQLQRADEFSIRFSRNNLYETKRIINEIKQLLGPYPLEGLPPGHTRLLFRKVILAYQAASQALQSYINYAKNPSNLEVPHKINELVLLIADLFLCCEHVSLPISDACIKNDAVRVCNDLIKILKSKVPVCEYVEIKDADLTKSKTKKLAEDGQKIKKLSMYKSKLTPKLKMEVLRKKHGIACLLGSRARKSRRDEKKAKITHEIYTQKLNPWQGKGSKIVKFDPENHEKSAENTEEQKPFVRRHRHMTPREVRSQDDDVVTMVQAIGDDETSTFRMSSTPRENDDEGEINQNCIKELLLEAIEGLRNFDKKEQKITLKKLLNTIENCSRTQNEAPGPERVKVFHFVSKDLLEEREGGEETSTNPTEETDANPMEETNANPAEATIEKQSKAEEQKQTPDSPPHQERSPGDRAEVLSGERKLKVMFKPLGGKKEAESEDAADIGKVKLKLSEETMRNASKYKKAFSEFRRSNIMYKKTLANKPWKLVGKISDHIILDIIKEISLDFENDAILKRLYLSELQEVMS